ncbi:AMP-binding protein [Rothia sp. AR01]|uniref:AMP-binding protein n=1 Tax=Rothia santali TaxID=2949643 RepID=A0A9X2HLT8_9MICC|nr:AMP-binding protein [Rothia santali]MCP3426658.1 AMP-binding protein [Rothia santali]
MSAQTDRRVQEIIEDVADPGRSAPDHFCDRHDPALTAFLVSWPGRRAAEHSFGELAERSRRVASYLAELGVGEGDRVATLMRRSFDLPVVVLAAWRLGAVYAPVFTALASESVGERLRRSGAKVVIADPELAGHVPEGEWAVVLSGSEGAGEAPALEVEAERLEPWEGAAPTGPDVPLVHLFTSGTTGEPKSVVHTKRHAAGWQSFLEHGLALRSGSVYWSAVDPGWSLGLYTALLAPMLAGRSSILTGGRFDAGSSWDVLSDLRVTDFLAAPTTLRAMRNSPDKRMVRHLDRMSSAGEAVTPGLFEWAEDLGTPVHENYGQTETGLCVGFPHDPELGIPLEQGVMGRPLPGWSITVLRMDEDDVAPEGEIGRLAIDIAASPFMTFAGYGEERDPDHDRFTADGAYYLTTDLAIRGGGGALRFAARGEDAILTSGYRLSPVEIENSLMSHPAVRRAAVVGDEDRDRGEIVHAYVVLEEDHEPGREKAEELQRWVKGNYGSHAFPRRVSFVDEIPTTANGKVQRSALRRRRRG